MNSDVFLGGVYEREFKISIEVNNQTWHESIWNIQQDSLIKVYNIS